MAAVRASQLVHLEDMTAPRRPTADVVFTRCERLVSFIRVGRVEETTCTACLAEWLTAPASTTEGR